MILNSVVIFAKDIQRTSAFYQSVLAMSVVEKASSHEVITNDSLELVIHGIPKKIANDIVIEDPPILRSATAMKPAFVVDSLNRVKQASKDNGGGVNPDSKIWNIRGARVLDGWDPEGNVIQFKEFKQ